MDEQTVSGLLECLLQEMGARYLSDLRLDPRVVRELRSAVTRLPAERFSRRQWADALVYLTADRPAPGEDAAALRDHLLTCLASSGRRPS